MAGMKRVRCIWKFLVCSCLFLILSTFTGCITPQVTVAPDAHLEKYRKVFLVPSRGDPRDVTPRILARLRQTGFDAIEVTSNSPAIDSQGSGFVITSQGHVLTCAHVIEKQTN